jgi:hypothetical protein
MTKKKKKNHNQREREEGGMRSHPSSPGGRINGRGWPRRRKRTLLREREEREVVGPIVIGWG